MNECVYVYTWHPVMDQSLMPRDYSFKNLVMLLSLIVSTSGTGAIAVLGMTVIHHLLISGQQWSFSGNFPLMAPIIISNNNIKHIKS